MARQIGSHFEFARRYEIEQLERIERGGGIRVVGFPGAVEVDAQLEMAAGPILRVEPADAAPWVGVFYGSDTYGVPPAAPGRLIGWPDGRSLCVVYAGSGTVVRTDNPDESYGIDCFPITDLRVVPSHELIVFAGFTNLTSYGAGGLRWTTDRLVWDDLSIVRVEGDRLIASGFNAPSNRNDEFAVNLATGHPDGSYPYESFG